MRYLLLVVCAVLSILAMSGGLLFGLFLMLAPSGGGFFHDLGVVIGIFVMGIGNLVSCICNGICWWAGKFPRWLAILTLIQTPPALVAAIIVMNEIVTIG